MRLPITAQIGNLAGDVLYAGAAPGYSGMLQTNIRIPVNAPRGNNVPVRIFVGGAPSQAGVTIAVQ